MVAKFENCQTVRETDMALLISVDGDEYWIPKSQIDDDSEVYKHPTEGVLIISEWLAIQKGLV